MEAQAVTQSNQSQTELIEAYNSAMSTTHLQYKDLTRHRLLMLEHQLTEKCADINDQEALCIGVKLFMLSESEQLLSRATAVNYRSAGLPNWSKYESMSPCISIDNSVWKQRYKHLLNTIDGVNPLMCIVFDRQIDLDDICFMYFNALLTSAALKCVLEKNQIAESVLVKFLSLPNLSDTLLSCIFTKDTINCINPSFVKLISYLACAKYPVQIQVAIDAICQRKDWIKLIRLYMGKNEYTPLFNSLAVISDNILQVISEGVLPGTKNRIFTGLVRRRLFDRANVFLKAGAMMDYQDMRKSIHPHKCLTMGVESYLYLINNNLDLDVLPEILALDPLLKHNTTIIGAMIVAKCNEYKSGQLTSLSNAKMQKSITSFFDNVGFTPYAMNGVIANATSSRDESISPECLMFICDLYLLNAVSDLSVARVKEVLDTDGYGTHRYTPSDKVLAECFQRLNAPVLCGDALIDFKNAIARPIITVLLQELVA